ncbi:MAG: glucose-1-phosphate adenylyltransferase subunit GlgD [Lachnospiraceae bacterium]
MAKAFGIITSSGNHIYVEGMQDYRPIGAFSFLGRYRVIDFQMSNMSNSGIEHVQVFLNQKPRSLVDHLGSGRHYNINSKRGKVQMLFSENRSVTDIYNTDIAAFAENIESIQKARCPYVIIAPSHMVYTQNYEELLDAHIASGADVSLLYHAVENANEEYFNCDVLKMNRQNGVYEIMKNSGNKAVRNIFMDTYVMKKELFVELIQEARKISSMYTLSQILNKQCYESKLDVRGIAHEGYFAALTDFKSVYKANMGLIDMNVANQLFSEKWPIYTRTNDSCPTQYFEDASVKNSVVSNGCLIEGTIEHSIIGRGCTIGKGCVIKNCIISSESVIADGTHLENLIVDKHASVLHAKEIIGEPENPEYVKRGDVI